MKHAVHFSSKTDAWSTPQWLFDELEEKYGPFDLDVCASRDNTKCERFFSLAGYHEPGAFYSCGNGLEGHWWALDNNEGFPKCWMNPPYGREIGKWVKKAYEESLKGCLVVCLLPARTDTRWFHDYCLGKADVTFLKGRLKFGAAVNSAPFPSMVVVFNPPGVAK